MLNNIQAQLQLHGKSKVDYISWWLTWGKDQVLWQPAKSSIWVRESYLSLMFRQVRKWTKIIASPIFISITRMTNIELGPWRTNKRQSCRLAIECRETQNATWSQIATENILANTEKPIIILMLWSINGQFLNSIILCLNKCKINTNN